MAIINETGLVNALNYIAQRQDILAQRQQTVMNYAILTRRLVYGFFILVAIIILVLIVIWLVKRTRGVRVRRKRK